MRSSSEHQTAPSASNLRSPWVAVALALAVAAGMLIAWPLVLPSAVVSLFVAAVVHGRGRPRRTVLMWSVAGFTATFFALSALGAVLLMPAGYEIRDEGPVQTGELSPR